MPIIQRCRPAIGQPARKATDYSRQDYRAKTSLHNYPLLNHPNLTMALSSRNCFGKQQQETGGWLSVLMPAWRQRMTTKKNLDYVLGTHDEEVARLGLQH